MPDQGASMSAEPLPSAASLRTDFAMLIDGQLSSSGVGSIEVINPATGAVFARCPAAGRAELDQAVVAARRAFRSWSALSFEDRAAAIKRMAAVLRSNQ